MSIINGIALLVLVVFLMTAVSLMAIWGWDAYEESRMQKELDELEEEDA